MYKTTVTFVDVSDLYLKLNLNPGMVEFVEQVGFSNVSWGDAEMTLVGNVFALDCIWEGLQDYHEMTEQELPYTLETFAAKYWELVGEADYINLEG